MQTTKKMIETCYVRYYIINRQRHNAALLSTRNNIHDTRCELQTTRYTIRIKQNDCERAEYSSLRCLLPNNNSIFFNKLAFENPSESAPGNSYIRSERSSLWALTPLKQSPFLPNSAILHRFGKRQQYLFRKINLVKDLQSGMDYLLISDFAR